VRVPKCYKEASDEFIVDRMQEILPSCGGCKFSGAVMTEMLSRFKERVEKETGVKTEDRQKTSAL
jgi:hypothetical protein